MKLKYEKLLLIVMYSFIDYIKYIKGLGILNKTPHPLIFLNRPICLKVKGYNHTLRLIKGSSSNHNPSNHQTWKPGDNTRKDHDKCNGKNIKQYERN